MGVMSCSRNKCDEIMCDTYVNNIGYICYQCQDEFKEYLKSKNLTEMNEREFKNRLSKFMETEKGFGLEKLPIDKLINEFFK